MRTWSVENVVGRIVGAVRVLELLTRPPRLGHDMDVPHDFAADLAEIEAEEEVAEPAKLANLLTNPDFFAPPVGRVDWELPDAPGPRPTTRLEEFGPYHPFVEGFNPQWQMTAPGSFKIPTDEQLGPEADHEEALRLNATHLDPLVSGVASATEAPPSVDASDRPAGDHPPSPAGHSNVPATVTRVVLVHKGGFTEKWAESWDLHVQDDGRTLKLFPRNQTAPRYEHTPGFLDIAPPR